MKTLIIYASKYGSTKKCAELLSAKLTGESVLHNIALAPVPPLEEFDKIVLGTSIKMGTIDPKLRAFCKNSEAALMLHPVYIFACAASDAVTDAIKSSFSPSLFAAMKSIQFVGGEMSADKAKGFDKIVYKMVGSSMKKTGKPIPSILEENVQILADVINQKEQL